MSAVSTVLSRGAKIAAYASDKSLFGKYGTTIPKPAGSNIVSGEWNTTLSPWLDAGTPDTMNVG